MRFGTTFGAFRVYRIIKHLYLGTLLILTTALVYADMPDNMSVKTIGITMGDPGGIGPEVIIKALLSEDIQKLLPSTRFLIIGDEATLARTTKETGIPFKSAVIDNPSKAGGLCLFNPCVGEADPGKMSLRYILSATELALPGPKSDQPRIDAIVTGPVSKEAISKTGHPFTGHTELLAKKTHTRRYVMMFCAGNLKVALATTHIPYKKLFLHLDTGRILNTIRITSDALKQYFGFYEPRIAVCGLNPHAGESGLMGREEKDIIQPAIEASRQDKVLCFGPLPADSVFYRAGNGEFDAVVALYHDQGIIPVKTMGFYEAAQVTLGLPIIRTSVAHGTAFDIAGKNIANPSSMIEAIQLANQMITHKAQLF